MSSDGLPESSTASMSNSKTAAIAGLTGLMLGLFLASALLRQCSRYGQDGFVTVTDTLVVTDTVTERYPVPVKETVTDTMLVSVADTVLVPFHDTVYMTLNRTQRYYHDNSYDVWVSGYRPRLDSIRIFPRTVYVSSGSVAREPVKRWGIGLQAGYGVGISGGQVKAFPYVGIGISYNLIRF